MSAKNTIDLTKVTRDGLVLIAHALRESISYEKLPVPEPQYFYTKQALQAIENECIRRDCNR